MKQYFGNNFYPKNFILLGPNVNELEEEAALIIKEAASRFPCEFSGKRHSFPFELRYVPPFDKAFNELKRLQGTAAVNAGYKDTFKGYIVVDLSAYLKHTDEDYFDIAMKFLYDQNEPWKYIFTVDGGQAKASLELVRKVLSILPCAVIEKENVTEADYIKKVCQTHNITLSRGAERFFIDMLKGNGQLRDVVDAVIYELSCRNIQYPKVPMSALLNYFSDNTSAVKYMLSGEQYSKVRATLEQLSREEDELGKKI